MTNKEKVLLFDYDGTIVDSLDVAFKSFNLTAEKYGIKRFKKKSEFVKLYDNNFYESLINLGIDSDKIQVFSEDLRNTFVFEGYAEVKAFPGIKRIINELSKDCKIIVVTSNITETIKSSINKVGIRVEDVIGGDLERSKVKKILDVKKKFPGFEVFYIGDTKGDILEGQKAGVKTIGATWGYHSKREIESVEPDFVIDKPDELLKIFK